MWRLWLRMLFNGRYGSDALGRFLLIAGLLLQILAIALRQGALVFILQLLGFALLLLTLLRMFSRDIGAREKEAQRFALLRQSCAKGLKRLRRELPRLLNGEFALERRVYKFLRCPRCAARLRLPRGKGRVMITCPRCGHKMEGKS